MQLALKDGYWRPIVMIEERSSKLKVNARSTSVTRSCGAVDGRECSMMKHQILAEMRKSDAPSWVAEELDKMLNCLACTSLGILGERQKPP
jgi:hypothetical protein